MFAHCLYELSNLHLTWVSLRYIINVLFFYLYFNLSLCRALQSIFNFFILVMIDHHNIFICWNCLSYVHSSIFHFRNWFAFLFIIYILAFVNIRDEIFNTAFLCGYIVFNIIWVLNLLVLKTRKYFIYALKCFNIFIFFVSMFRWIYYIVNQYILIVVISWLRNRALYSTFKLILTLKCRIFDFVFSAFLLLWYKMLLNLI